MPVGFIPFHVIIVCDVTQKPGESETRLNVITTSCVYSFKVDTMQEAQHWRTLVRRGMSAWQQPFRRSRTTLLSPHTPNIIRSHFLLSEVRPASPVVVT